MVLVETYYGRGGYERESVNVSESEVRALEELKEAFGTEDVTHYLRNLAEQRRNITPDDIYAEMIDMPIIIKRRWNT